MYTKRIILLVILALASVAVLGCRKAEATPRPSIPEDSAIRILGAVAQEYGWTLAEIKAMETMQVEAQDRDGKTGTYTGVKINTLLDQAQPKPEATTLQFKADYGYVVDVPLDKVRACANCLVAFKEGSDQLSSVMPGFDTTAQVDGLVRILVK